MIDTSLSVKAEYKPIKYFFLSFFKQKYQTFAGSSLSNIRIYWGFFCVI